VGTAQLGTITNIASGNSPLTLQTGTSPTTAVTIDTSQNVGIGTSSPSQKLSVNGNAIILGGNTLYFTGTANTNAMYIKAPDNTGALTFSPNGTEAMRIDSSGILGVGVTPSAWGANYSKAIQVSTQGAYVAGNTSSYSGGTYAWFGNNGYLDSSGVFRYTISSSACQYTQVANQHIWSYAASGTAGNTISFSEAMRIDSSGNLLVGTTSQYGTGKVCIGAAGGATADLVVYRPTVNQYYNAAIFNSYAGGTAGYIQINAGGTTTTYSTSSDYRLKEDIAPMTGALNTVSKLKPVTYTWKADGSNGQGFIAHELQEIVPDCVTGEKDAVDAEGKPVYQGIDTSFLVATLTAAIQEQQTLITDLTTRLAALEAK
jgi:hypothetical protein